MNVEAGLIPPLSLRGIAPHLRYESEIVPDERKLLCIAQSLPNLGRLSKPYMRLRIVCAGQCHNPQTDQRSTDTALIRQCAVYLEALAVKACCFVCVAQEPRECAKSYQ